MLKKKYYTLKKEEKDKLREGFYKTSFGQGIKARLRRLFATGIVATLFSIYLFVSADNVWNYIYASLTLLFGLFFIIGSYFIRIDKLNKYLLKTERKK